MLIDICKGCAICLRLKTKQNKTDRQAAAVPGRNDPKSKSTQLNPGIFVFVLPFILASYQHYSVTANRKNKILHKTVLHH